MYGLPEGEMSTPVKYNGGTLDKATATAVKTKFLRSRGVAPMATMYY